MLARKSRERSEGGKVYSHKKNEKRKEKKRKEKEKRKKKSIHAKRGIYTIHPADDAVGLV